MIGLLSDCSPCRRVVRGNACSGNTAAHTAPLPAAALRQCLAAIFLPPSAFLGRAAFLCTVPLPLLSVAVGLAQGKQGKRHGKGTPTFRETVPMKVCPDKRRPSSADTWGCCPERRRPDVAALRGTVRRKAASKSIPLGPTLDHYLRLLSHR